MTVVARNYESSIRMIMGVRWQQAARAADPSGCIPDEIEATADDLSV
jgi:hypothetical protein